MPQNLLEIVATTYFPVIKFENRAVLFGDKHPAHFMQSS